MTQSPPPKYICPLTLDIMKEPVMSRWGHTFEREAVMEWLAIGNDHCPMTRKRLRPCDLVSNKLLQQEIQEWRQTNGILDEKSNFIPASEFICPLTKEIMRHPVVSRHGVNYERAAIVAWFNEGYDFCPLTGKPLKPSGLVPNITLAKKIQKWKQENGVGNGDMEESHGHETCCLANVELSTEGSDARYVRRIILNVDDRVMVVST